MVRKHRRLSVNHIRLILVTVLAVQFPKVLCLVVMQITQALSEPSDNASLTFQNINFTNITELDLVARRAIRNIHQELDQNEDGNVSVTEGAKYIHQGEFNESPNDNLPSFETDKDGRITEVEFWEAWIQSEVHNWTVSQMAEWVAYDVDLPQYASKFKQYAISGAAMPILASSNNSVVLSLVEGAKDHRLKLWLKALEIVVCGYSQSKPSFLKDLLLTVSLALALGGILFGVHYRHKATAAVSAMQEKLNHLQNELQTLDDENDATWMKDLPATCPDDTSDKNTERTGSTTSLSSDTTAHARMVEALEELAETKALLDSAEERLRTTYQVEIKLHDLKRQQAHKKVEQTKAQFQKMKKKVSLFSSVQLIHSRQVDSFDVEVQLAKDALHTVQRDWHEHRKRWSELESICKYKFAAATASSAAAAARSRSSVSASRRRSAASSGERQKAVDVDDVSIVTNSTSCSTDSTEQLDKLGSLPDVASDRPAHRGSSSLETPKRNSSSFPSLPEMAETHQRKSDAVTRSSSDCSVRPTPVKLSEAREAVRSDSLPRNGRVQSSVTHSATIASFANYVSAPAIASPRKSPKPAHKAKNVVTPPDLTRKTPSVHSLPDLVRDEAKANGVLPAKGAGNPTTNGDGVKKHKSFGFFRKKKSK